MKQNMGAAYRTIRLLVAAIIAIVILTGVLHGTAAIILGAVAGIFLLTGFVRVCPLYLPFGINTNKNKQ
jgi:hypothetical protein